MGPRYLFLRSEKIDEITDFLVKNMEGKVTDSQKGLEDASEYSTVCFITDINHEKTYVEDAKKVVLVNDGSSAILSKIINSHECDLLHKVDMGPTSIVMRLPGNEERLVKKLKEIFEGREVDWVEGIGIGEKDDTIIAFTNKVLSGPIADFLHTKLLIPLPARIVRDKLGLEGLRLITQSLDDSQWYELRINIYDSYGKYMENYERLTFILSKLEIGMILGESWTKDFAVMLYSVLTYQMRLFTFFEPSEVKKILMALEYNNEGKRMVDFDLYYKNKKIYWYEVNKDLKKKTKPEAAKELRKSLYEKLMPEDIAVLEGMEKAIIEKYNA